MCLSFKFSNGQTLLFGIVYRPPGGQQLDNFFELIESNLPKFNHIIIAGDFNSRLESNINESRNFKRLARELNLHLVDTGFSFHRTLNPTRLDAILVSNISKVLKYIKSGSGYLCGHDYIVLFYDINIQNILYDFVFRSTKEVNQKMFN